VPVLGICYGLQFMVYALGGKVRRPRSVSMDMRPSSRVARVGGCFEGVAEGAFSMDVAWRLGRRVAAGISLTAKTANAVAAVENAEQKCGPCSFIRRCTIPR